VVDEEAVEKVCPVSGLGEGARTWTLRSRHKRSGEMVSHSEKFLSLRPFRAARSRVPGIYLWKGQSWRA
jgi:hypothetical protein